jgi:hypothetical protein
MGGRAWTRTRDRPCIRRLLYQLSYAPKTLFTNLLPAADFRYNSLFLASAKLPYSSLYTTFKPLIFEVVIVCPDLCSRSLRTRLFVIPLYNLPLSSCKMYTVYIEAEPRLTESHSGRYAPRI